MSAHGPRCPTPQTFVPLNDLMVDGAAEPLLRLAGLDSLDALFTATGERLGKPDLATWRERLRLLLRIGDSEATMYLKRFRHPPASARRQVRRSGTGAGSVAGMEWGWMQRLAGDGVPCPEPVACGEEVRRGREVRSALLMREVPGRSLENLCREWTLGQGGANRRLLFALADLVAKLHGQGYVHRDLYLSHVFHDAGAPPEHALHLIDLQRVMRPVVLRGRWFIKDLAALNHSTPRHILGTIGRVRWLRRYVASCGWRTSCRPLVYLIAGKTARMDRHAARKRGLLGSPGAVK